MSDLEVKIRTIVSDHLGCSPEQMVGSAAFVEDLGADSLDSVSILIAIEETLGIEISDEEALRIKTIQEAIDFAKARVAS